ncbi:histidyl-tRNA synthetase domain protein [Helicobacter pylori Hp H-18]|nr:histidyl-tRNA synthetase domain protein [Helicobacter pylori Hp H-18]
MKSIFSYANRLAESLRQSGIFSEVYPEAQKNQKTLFLR